MENLKFNPLTEEQKKLIEDNLGFAYYWFSLHHIYDEDRQQDLLYSLCKYIHLYDEERGTITTFMGAVFQSKNIQCTQQEYNMKKIAEKFAIRFEDTAYTSEDGSNVTWADILSYNEHGFSDFEKTELYKFYLKKLKSSKSITPTQLKIFLAYLNTGNQREIARMYNISTQAVSEAIQNVKRKIKREKWAKAYE